MWGCRLERISKSPRWNAGAIDSDVTQTIGVAETVKMHKPFHAMNVVLNARRNGSAVRKGLLHLQPIVLTVMITPRAIKNARREVLWISAICKSMSEPCWDLLNPQDIEGLAHSISTLQSTRDGGMNR